VLTYRNVPSSSMRNYAHQEQHQFTLSVAL
jgi:hypothetical protein